MCEGVLVSVTKIVLLVKIQAKPFDLNVIQVYAPTGDHTEDEVEEFYEDLNKARKMCKSQEVVMVIGDLNAKVGKGVESQVVGPYGLGERNDRGERWVEWCRENRFMIANTWFCNHPRRLGTWKSPGDLVRNQIDYIRVVHGSGRPTGRVGLGRVGSRFLLIAMGRVGSGQKF